ncbi:MAG: aldehyde dehydrogenase family protein [Alphaproteobacteria bacterium]|nr:aldehyde dehydrogenase family protein [Alphaproteobacteria bacterium]MBU1515189.1 aldehyde dehydrogenase family protein [Alphaproteobacteria bacterium]MBU2092319.1 aldehyde dehydrogenase family protein [Alphaproteobacteria bacterium]MBU2152913.1 aldehyde dehydrogenase family protein [Alphaproteobacteria bacterium]MBU2305744.1 aldehyde dehydrogenase family protein [Alphaproteobacteria bacterium]
MKPQLIGGEWVTSPTTAPNINPSDTTDVIAEFAQADASQASDAVAAASDAFAAWSRGSIQRRSEILDAVGSELVARAPELGRLLAREEGKTLPEGVGEATRAGQVFKFFAGEALRISGESQRSVRPGVDVSVTREPLGVVALITPWNFPLAIPAWKAAAALACGNTVVLKPAELTPACAWALADIIQRAGAPAGVFNLVSGPGSVVGAALVEDARVGGVSFTGSTTTGARVGQACMARNARVQLEMGGKNPLVVLDDADLDLAVECAVNGAFYSTGQRCTASSRLIVTEAIHDRFVAALAERLRALVVGHALEDGVHIGPVVDQRQLDIDRAYIEIGEREGARLLTGGDLVSRPTAGHFLSPALFVDVDNSMRIAREEIFGPVAAVIRVRNFDEALAVANDTPYGLSAGICTGSLKHATAFRQEARAGMVMVNLPTAGVDPHVPFGGQKASSYGPREQGRYAAEFYTTVKTAYAFAG